MGILWIVIIGFVAGIIARLLSPGPNKPAGFLLTTVLGIIGAFVATFIGQAVGWYRPEQGAGFIAATVGAIVLLFVWNRFEASRALGSKPALNRPDAESKSDSLERLAALLVQSDVAGNHASYWWSRTV